MWANQIPRFEVLEVSPGEHDLWHGAIVNGAGIKSGWQSGAWIDIVGVLDKVYPTFNDDRNVEYNGYRRYPSCTYGMPHNPIFYMCTAGEMFWSKTRFTVGWGTGGAVQLDTPGTIQMQNITFANNSANQGSAASIIGAKKVTVRDSRFTGSQQLSSTTPEDKCATGVCSAGERCVFESHSISCVGCLKNEVGDGLECSVCPPGMHPDHKKQNCIACPAGTAADFGICNSCGESEFAASVGTKICLPCGSQTRASTDRTSCVCVIQAHTMARKSWSCVLMMVTMTTNSLVLENVTRTPAATPAQLTSPARSALFASVAALPFDPDLRSHH
eukprot:COSAG05_NODE_3932_length_1768_cov_1.053925_2_plen_330_part_00